MLAKKETAVANTEWLDSPWTDFFQKKDQMKLPSTWVKESTLTHIGQVFSSEPEDFVIHGGMDQIPNKKKIIVIA